MNTKNLSKTRHKTSRYNGGSPDYTTRDANKIRRTIGTYYLVYTLFLAFIGSQGLSDMIDALPWKYLIISIELILLAVFAFIYFSYRLILEGWVNKWVLRFIIAFNSLSPAYFFYRFVYHAPKDQSMLQLYYVVNVFIPVSISLFFLKLWIQALRDFVPETYKIPQIS